MSLLRSGRLRVLGYVKFRLRTIGYYLRTGQWRMLGHFLFVCAFSRDSGLALLDPVWRRFPKLNPYPWQIEVENTTRCHLRCPMCEHTYWKLPPRDMTFGEFKRVVDQFPKLKWIGTTGIGGSFLNKDFLRMIQYVKSRDVYAEMFDSFDRVKEEDLRALLGYQMDKIWISMEAATKATYEQIRVGADFDRVTNNIRLLMRLKKESGRPIPEVWFHFIISKLNAGEMLAYVDLVKDLAGDTQRNGTMIYWTALMAFDKTRDMEVKVAPETREAIDRRCRQLGIYSVWNDNVTRDRPVVECMRWTQPFVLSSGHVQCCCAINEANERDYQVQTSFGNLFEEDFHDIWYSDRYRNFVKTLRSGKFPACCKNCRIFRECH